ncbi:desampylase [Halomarina litorea]|uniref:desampylase n=1 Tax=Halomarina litorea TaxID=2961595 RepID=UPI0020C336BD|nr:desampylase [Halomarina sp. BCD28]
MATLELPAEVYDAVVAHAREGAPEEVCGVLGGRREAGTCRVSRAERVPNVASTPETRYQLDPGDQLAAMRAVEDADGEVVGFYHSHPRGPRRPSATDEAQATWPDASYVIVSLDGTAPFVGSWRWTGERFEEEAVRVD